MKSGRWLRRRLRLRAAFSGARVQAAVSPQVRADRTLRVLIGRGSQGTVRMAARASIGPLASLSLAGGRLDLGEDVRVGERCLLETEGGEVRVGDGARLGAGSIIRARGARVVIGAGATLDDLVIALADGRSVRVGTGADIGMKATLLPGADVAPGARVPAHTVVSGPWPPQGTTSSS